MDIEILVQTYPRLFHMSEDGSFASIQRQGFLSATALLDLYETDAHERQIIEGQRRPESVPISRAGFPDAIIRDNKPLSDGALLKCLSDDLTLEQWYRILNQKTFFWLHKKRLWRLLGAKAYRLKPQTILTVDTASLVATHKDRILLSPINSGSTIFAAQPRGMRTFLPIESYPFEARRKSRTVEDALVELTVDYSVPDIMDHLIAAHRYDNQRLVEIWRRPGTSQNDGPQK